MGGLNTANKLINLCAGNKSILLAEIFVGIHSNECEFKNTCRMEQEHTSRLEQWKYESKSNIFGLEHILTGKSDAKMDTGYGYK